MIQSKNRAIAGLNWRDYGGHGETMVLVHGLGGSLANWDAVGPRLAKERRVLALDLPGFGFSPPGPDYRVETQVRAVIAFIEALKTPVTLMGNSMGGLICELVAAQRPDLIDHLILVAPATPLRLPDPGLDWMTVIRLGLEATPGLGWLILRLVSWRLTPEQIVDLSLRMVTHDHTRVPPDVVESLVDNVTERARLPWAIQALNRAATSIASAYRRPRDFVSIIRKIACQTLVIQGIEDRIVSPNAVKWMASLRSDWTLIHMEDTGHTPQLDAPVRFCREIEDWLAGDISRSIPESAVRRPN